MVDIYRGAKGLGYDEINERGRKAFTEGENIAFREGGGKNAASDDDKNLRKGRVSGIYSSHISVEVEVDVIGGGKRYIRHSIPYVDIYSQVAVIEEKNFPTGIRGKTIRSTEEALMGDIADA